MFRTFLAIAFLQSVLGDGSSSYPYPPVPPYPCIYVGNVFDVKQPGVTCPQYDPIFKSYHYGPIVPAEVFYFNFNQYIQNRQDFVSEHMRYNHDLQNMYVNNEYEFYKQSPWGLPPGYDYYHQNQKKWLEYTQTLQNNNLEWFKNNENKWFGLNPSTP